MPRRPGGLRRVARFFGAMANLAALAVAVGGPARACASSAAAGGRAAASLGAAARRRGLHAGTTPTAAFALSGGAGGGVSFSRRGFPISVAAPTRGASPVAPSYSRSGPFRRMSQVFMAVDDDDASEEDKTLDSAWDISGLKKEAARQTLRCIKKVGKASTRLTNAEAQVEELLSDPEATPEELEKCPNVEAMKVEVDALRSRLTGLNTLEETLQSIKKKKTVLPEEAASLALELGLDDAPPQRAPRGPKKKKGPRASEVAPRMPYRKYYAKDQTEIRVGKQAPDNDELSINPAHRDGDDWWMHASGCPGSHIVIRCHDQNLDEEVVKDAAALAARQSKCAGQVIKVSMVKCRQVTKPRGAKAGLVQLNGSVRTVSVNMKEAEARLDRLDETMVMN